MRILQSKAAVAPGLIDTEMSRMSEENASKRGIADFAKEKKE